VSVTVWVFDHFDAVCREATDFGEITQDKGHYAVQDHKGHRFRYKLKARMWLIGLLVNNSNLHLLSPFPRCGGLLVNFRCRQGKGSLMHSFGVKPLNSGEQNLAPRNKKHASIVRCRKYFVTLNRLGVTHEYVERTDGQTNRRTDFLTGNTFTAFVWPIRCNGTVCLASRRAWRHLWVLSEAISVHRVMRAREGVGG